MSDGDERSRSPVVLLETLASMATTHHWRMDPRWSESDTPRRVELNAATREDLEDLGLGPDPIERILHHRETHGLFQTWEDLAMVAQLEPRLVDALRQRVKLGSALPTSEQDVRVAARASRVQPHVLEPSPPSRLRGDTDKPTPGTSLDVGGYTIKP